MVAIPTKSDAFLFGNNCRICTVLVTCPKSSYQFYVFSHLDQKLRANADLFRANRQEGKKNVEIWTLNSTEMKMNSKCVWFLFFVVWVEAPSPGYCRPPPPSADMICTILGRYGYEQGHRWRVFCNAAQKFNENAQLLRQSQQYNLNYYQGTPMQFSAQCSAHSIRLRYLHLILYSFFSVGWCSTGILSWVGRSMKFR